MKDGGNEGSNNSAIGLAEIMDDCLICTLKDKRSNGEFFNLNGKFGIFNSVRLKKKRVIQSLLLFGFDSYKFYSFFKSKKVENIILNNLLMFNILFAALISRKKVFVFIRELHMPTLLVRFYGFLSGKGIITLLSNNHAIKEKYPYLKLEVVPNLVKLNDIGKPRHFKGNTVRILSVGSIYQIKNQLLLVEICEFLKLHFSHLNIIIDHYGEIIDELYYKMVVDNINNKGLNQNFNFKGKVSNLDLLGKYDLYDVYIQTSHTEGMSRALMDAINHSLLCIASDVGDTKLLINENTGVLFNDENVFEKLNGFESNLCNKLELVNNAKQNLSEHFSKKIVLKKLIELGI
jgi:glycosyltransferase involved in cell wall biosynthesis